MKYEKLIDVYESLQATTKRLEKIKILSDLFRETSVDDLTCIILLIQGKIFPSWDKQKSGVAARLLLQSISVATGFEIPLLEKKWKEAGDLGEVAADCVQHKTQETLFSENLQVDKVFSNLKKLALTEGRCSMDIKVKLIAELLTSAAPLEAKYIVRTALDEMRIGVGDGSMRDAIAWTFLYDVQYDSEKNDIILEDRKEYVKAVEAVQHAYNILNDFSSVTLVAKNEGISGLMNVKFTVGKPLKVMLYKSAPNIADAMKRLSVPLAVEPKYDGFRMQIHKSGDMVNIFTRRLENVTVQFPDVVEAVKKAIVFNGIFDAEAVGIELKTGKMLPFQSISQRIKRKHDIQKMADKFPVKVFVFDMLAHEREILLNTPFQQRRKLVEQSVTKSSLIQPSELILSEDEQEIVNYYHSCLKGGYEGAMLKRLDAGYKPGLRVGYGMKIKPVLESLDVVIVSAEWGEGKRAGWLTSFTLAVKSEEGFVEIGKVGTGIKEKESEGLTFHQLTELLRPHILEEHGRTVKIHPAIVIEVHYEEIQKSPTYSSGFALRFPRVVRLRNDEKDAEECNTLSDLAYLSETQKGRSSD